MTLKTNVNQPNLYPHLHNIENNTSFISDNDTDKISRILEDVIYDRIPAENDVKFLLGKCFGKESGIKINNEKYLKTQEYAGNALAEILDSCVGRVLEGDKNSVLAKNIAARVRKEIGKGRSVPPVLAGAFARWEIFTNTKKVDGVTKVKLSNEIYKALAMGWTGKDAENDVQARLAHYSEQYYITDNTNNTKKINDIARSQLTLVVRTVALQTRNPQAKAEKKNAEKLLQYLTMKGTTHLTSDALTPILADVNATNWVEPVSGSKRVSRRKKVNNNTINNPHNKQYSIISVNNNNSPSDSDDDVMLTIKTTTPGPLTINYQPLDSDDESWKNFSFNNNSDNNNCSGINPFENPDNSLILGNSNNINEINVINPDDQLRGRLLACGISKDLLDGSQSGRLIHTAKLVQQGVATGPEGDQAIKELIESYPDIQGHLVTLTPFFVSLGKETVRPELALILHAANSENPPEIVGKWYEQSGIPDTVKNDYAKFQGSDKLDLNTLDQVTPTTGNVGYSVIDLYNGYEPKQIAEVINKEKNQVALGAKKYMLISIKRNESKEPTIDGHILFSRSSTGTPEGILVVQGDETGDERWKPLLEAVPDLQLTTLKALDLQGYYPTPEDRKTLGLQLGKYLSTRGSKSESASVALNNFSQEVRSKGGTERYKNHLNSVRMQAKLTSLCNGISPRLLQG